jgi:hypothetical protein
VLFQFFDVRFSGAPVNGVLQHQSGLAALRREELGQEKLLQNGHQVGDDPVKTDRCRYLKRNVKGEERHHQHHNQHQAEKAQQAASGNTDPAVASSDDARKAAVAAALARAKARKAELVGNTSDSSAINAEQEPAASVDQEAARKAAVAAAIARAKAKNAQTEAPVVPVANVEQATEAVDPDAARKAAVAAAIARAKAKKAQAEADSASNTEKQG